MVLILLCVTAVVAKSNIILIVTDDQDVTLGGLTPMTKTRRMAEESGVIFDNAFVTTPICCPARTSLLTGLYQHNHGVSNNSVSGGCGAIEKPTLAYVMSDAGYKTFYAGKYLNQYKGISPEVYYDFWAGLVGNSAYYNYSMNVNGLWAEYRDKPEDYLTDVLSTMATDFIEKSSEPSKPFFMVIAPPAPHEPFTPSEKYKNKFSSILAPRTPNFNTGSTNKHWLIRNNKFLNAAAIKKVDETFQRRWETLLSVDDLVAAVTNVAPKDTYIFITSDHGFHMGQFSQAWDKRQPYEHDIRVPLIVLGPNLPAGAKIPNPVLNIDLAPTFYAIAGVENTDWLKLDGFSFWNLLTQPSPFAGRQFQIEYAGEGGGGGYCFQDPNVKLCSYDLNCNCFDARNNSYSCIRNFSLDNNTLECRFYEDVLFFEAYDLNKDPYQLTNLATNDNGTEKNVRNFENKNVILI